MKIGKSYRFEAAHDLPNHMGKCSRLHGHSYKVDITVTGQVNEEGEYSDSGMVVDFDILDQAMHPIIEALDHYYLNDVLKERTTAENVLWYIKENLETNLLQFEEAGGVVISNIKLWETEKGYAEWNL